MALNEASVFMGEGEEGYLDLEMERRLPRRYRLSSPPLFFPDNNAETTQSPHLQFMGYEDYVY